MLNNCFVFFKSDLLHQDITSFISDILVVVIEQLKLIQNAGLPNMGGMGGTPPPIKACPPPSKKI